MHGCAENLGQEEVRPVSDGRPYRLIEAGSRVKHDETMWRRVKHPTSCCGGVDVPSGEAAVHGRV